MSSIGTISGGSPTIRGSPSTIVVSLLNAFMLSFVRPLATFASSRFSALASFAVASCLTRATRSSTSIREYQMSRFRIAANVADVLAVRAAHLPVDLRPLLLVEAAVAAGDREARHEALHVPLERAGKRLVEVVEAEDELAVGCGEAAEVRQVRVAAELRVERRCGGRSRDPRPSGRRPRGRT